MLHQRPTELGAALCSSRCWPMMSVSSLVRWTLSVSLSPTIITSGQLVSGKSTIKLGSCWKELFLQAIVWFLVRWFQGDALLGRFRLNCRRSPTKFQANHRRRSVLLGELLHLLYFGWRPCLAAVSCGFAHGVYRGLVVDLLFRGRTNSSPTQGVWCSVRSTI